MDAVKRFMDKIQPVTESGCWIWMASLNTRTGYGQFGLNGGMEFAHRASYKLFRGDIPETICVLHKCDVRPCVNPNHLFLGTKKDNAQDAISKGRRRIVLKDKCVNGHSSWRQTSKRRYCRECIRDGEKRYRSTDAFKAKHATYERERRRRLSGRSS